MIYRILLVATLFFSFSTSAQNFQNITQSITGSFAFSEISEANNIAIIGGGQVSKSIDEGFTWTEMDLGTEGVPWTVYEFTDAVIIDNQTYVLIGEDFLNLKSKAIVTNDGGLTWTNTLETANQSNNLFSQIIEVSGTIIIAAKGGVYRSTNNGVSWSFVPVVAGQNIEVQYNTTTNDVLLNTPAGFYRSSDAGLTWTLQSVPFYGGVNEQVTNQNGNWLITQTNNTQDAYIALDPSYNVISSTIVNTPLYDGTFRKKCFDLNNGQYFTYDENNFYNIDQSSNNAFVYTENLQGATINDVEFGSSYGLAVGSSGAVSRITFTGTSSLFLPAEIETNAPVCFGQTISISTPYDYADSIEWVFDGSIVSNSASASFTAPSIGGSYPLELTLWVGSNSETNIVNYTVNGLTPPPTYDVNVSNPTPCYGYNVNLTASYVNGDMSNATVEYWLDSTLIQGPDPVSSGTSFFQTIPNIEESTVFTVIVTQVQNCGISIDTTTIPINVLGDFTQDYQLISIDSVVCMGEYPEFQFTDLVSTHTYELLWHSGGSTYTMQTFSGNPGDTISAYGAMWDFGLGNQYGNDTSSYSISITDNIACPNLIIPIGEVVSVHDLAIFFLESEAQYRNDTLAILNAFPLASRVWSEPSNSLNLYNITDTVPIIFGDTTGIFTIELHEEAFPGCDAQWSENVRICDPLPIDIKDTCLTHPSDKFVNILDVQYDPQGNVYEVGVVDAILLNGFLASYVINKRDTNGVLLWTKGGGTQYTNTGHQAIIIQDIAVDYNGDVYCSYWISVYSSYNQELITNSMLPSDYMSFIVKLDGTTGNMLWAKPLSDYINVTAAHRITDILIDGNQIHFAACASGTFQVLTIDPQGNIQDISLSVGASNAFSLYTSPAFNFNGNGSSGAQLSPQLRKLPDGKILVTGMYRQQMYYQSQTVSQLTLPSGVYGVFAAKYTTADQFTDFTLLASHVEHMEDHFQYLNVATDIEGNTTYSYSDWNNNLSPLGSQNSVIILDSTIANSGATILFQIDSAFQKNWINIGKFSWVNDLDIIPGSNELVVTGKSHANMAFTHNDSHYMIGEVAEFPEQSGYIHNYDQVNQHSQAKDVYIFRFNQDGSMIDGRFFESDASGGPSKLGVQTAVESCGNLRVLINNNDPSFYSNNPTPDTLVISDHQSTYVIPESQSIVLSDNCASPQICSYIQLPDTLYDCMSDSIIFYFSNALGVDSVAYDFYADGMLINSDSQNDLSPLVLYPPSNTNVCELIFSVPFADTVHILSHPTTNYNLMYNADMCINTGQTIIVNSMAEVYWDNATIPNDSLDFFTSTAGVQDIPFLVSFQNGCQYVDTVSINVLLPLASNFASSYAFTCSDTLIIPVDSNLYSSVDFELNGISVVNEFNTTNTPFGTNNLIISYIDSNGCANSAASQVISTPPIDAPITTFYNMYCDSTVILEFDTMNFSSPVWTQGGVNVSDTVTANNLSNGSNYFTVSYIDSNGCNNSSNVVVFKNIIQKPNLDSLILLGCNDSMSLSINSSFYVSESYYLNGTATTNQFSGSNLQQGLNEVTIELVDDDNCIIRDTVLIDYCYDLGISAYTHAGIRLYPNPTDYSFTLILPKAQEVASIHVSDHLGRIVQELDINSDKIVTAIEGEPGVYTIIIEFQEGSAQIPLVKVQ
ncbi:MAG: T9SS type A sorting domain-containing protein [bacterium]|nr:T9SS type A sorting domain-containing protein [bacterium]